MRASKTCCSGLECGYGARASKFRHLGRGQWKLEWFCEIRCVFYGRLAVLVSVHQPAPHVPGLTGTLRNDGMLRLAGQWIPPSNQESRLPRLPSDWQAGWRLAGWRSPATPRWERCEMEAPHWPKAAVRLSRSYVFSYVFMDSMGIEILVRPMAWIGWHCQSPASQRERYPRAVTFASPR